MKLNEKLINPPAQNRTLPFWSWNDILDPEVLRSQIKAMSKAKVGGYFMHARSGLKTSYLEEPWFEAIQTGLEEGREENLLPWVYDEEGWPSGFAGGKVTALGDAYHARGLRMQLHPKIEEIQQTSTLLGIYAYTHDFKQIHLLENIPENFEIEGYISMTHSVSPYYIDILNPITTKAFLEATHESYAARFGNEMPEGFFTDEPRLSEGPIPWSYILPQEFEKDHEYSLLPQLPALYLPCEGYEAVRTDFWATVSRLFVHSYMEQIYDWCELHHTKLTGHMMMEESLYSQMTGTSGSMPFYEFFHMPGIDSLRRMIHDPRMPKQVSSVAEQFGKHRVISESYALSGWDLNFEEMRWIANWQFVNGVNIICQHLQAYSLKGFRKRDYPPSLFIQQSWWDEYHRFNDYLARLSTLLIEGKKQVEVLLLHPMHTGWITYDGTNNEEIQTYDAAFSEATQKLSGLHIDYHLGDETILAEHAQIKEGKLMVGEYSYSQVILPPLKSIDASTAHLLIEFVKQGGYLYRLGDAPELIDGRPNSDLSTLLETCLRPLTSDTQIIDQVKTRLNNRISISKDGIEEPLLHYCLHDQEEALSLFVVNNSKYDRLSNINIDLGQSYQVSILDLESNEETILNSSTQSFTADFEAMEGRVYLLRPIIPNISTSPIEGKNQILIRPDTNWNIKQMDQNILTLDCCKYRVDGSDWREKKAVIKIMKELLALQRSCSFELRFDFTVIDRLTITAPLYLVIEESKNYEISVNGKPVSKVTGFYKDHSFETIDITPAVIEGENIITLTGVFKQSEHVYRTLFGGPVYETELNKLTYDMELESIYILGNFGAYSTTPFAKREKEGMETEGPFFITKAPCTVNHGSFTEQGLLCFAGSLELEQTLDIKSVTDKQVLLDLGSPRLPLLQLWVNDQMVKTFLWAPWKVDISPHIHKGSNKVTLKLFASNRNMLGPHHHINGENYSVGPQSFEGVFSWLERPSEAVPIDRSLASKSYWSDSYTFVRFGF